jgi:phosphoenolpyruvate carboxykinase (ATP)
LASHPIQAFLLNTGRVGGGDGDVRSKKLKIPHTSACVKGIAEDTIEWTDDPDFRYQIAASVPGIEDPELLQPKRLYDRQGRIEEYTALVDRLKSERVERLQEFPQLSEDIIKAVG